jgi:hypothetical protein
MLSSFPLIAWLGFFSLACPDLVANCHPNSKTYTSHSYSSWLKQCRRTATATIHTFHIFSLHSLHLLQAQLAFISTFIHLHISHRHVERACWAHILLSSTTSKNTCIYIFEHTYTVYSQLYDMVNFNV